MKISRIKAIGYCDSRDYAVHDQGLFIAKKTRPTDIHGVYKAEQAYKLEFDKNDLKEFLKLREFGGIPTTEALEYLQKKGVLPNKRRLLLYNHQYNYAFINSNGYAESISADRTDTAELIVFVIDDFVQCKPTKKELAEIEKLDNRKNNFKLNNLVAKENIVKALTEQGYDCEEIKYDWQPSSFIKLKSKKAFNKLVSDAIENYLNGIVLKHLGCKIHIPKQKTSHCYSWNDELCYIGDIELCLNEGEQNVDKGN